MLQDLSLNNKNTKAGNLHETAVNHFRNRDFNNLSKVCAQLLKENSNDYFAIEALLFCMKQENNIPAQEKCLEGLLRLKPILRNLNDYAQFLYDQARFEESMILIQENLASVREQKDSDLEVTNRILGNLSIKLGDIESAEQYYHMSLRLNPRSDNTISNVAALYLSQGDLDRARDYYQQALKENQRNDKAWMGLAMCHLSKKDSQLFWANIKNAIDIKPFEKKYLKFAANQALVDCEYVYVTKKIEVFLRNYPLDEEMNSFLISLLFQAGKKQNAYLQLEHLKSVNPHHPDIIKYKEILGVSGD